MVIPESGQITRMRWRCGGGCAAKGGGVNRQSSRGQPDGARNPRGCSCGG